MSTDKHTLNEKEVVISGEVIDVDRRTSAAGKGWAIITIETQHTYRDELTIERYPVKAFGGVMESAGQVNQGDMVTAMCRLKSKNWNDKWYIDLALNDIDITQVSLSSESEQTESGTVEKFIESDWPDQGLPF